MRAMILAAIPFVGGCAWWQAGVHSPEVVTHAIAEAQTYQALGNATGIPYGGMVAATLAMILSVLIGGYQVRKQVRG